MYKNIDLKLLENKKDIIKLIKNIDNIACHILSNNDKIISIIIIKK